MLPTPSALRVPNKLSSTALSQHLPLRDMLAMIPDCSREQAIRSTAILTASITLMQQSCFGAAASESPVQSVFHSLFIAAARHRPSHYPS